MAGIDAAVYIRLLTFGGPGILDASSWETSDRFIRVQPCRQGSAPPAGAGSAASRAATGLCSQASRPRWLMRRRPAGLQLFLAVSLWVLVVVLPTNLVGNEVAQLENPQFEARGFAYWLSPPPPARADAPPTPTVQIKVGCPSLQARQGCQPS